MVNYRAFLSALNLSISPETRTAMEFLENRNLVLGRDFDFTDAVDRAVELYALEIERDGHKGSSQRCRKWRCEQYAAWKALMVP